MRQVTDRPQTDRQPQPPPDTNLTLLMTTEWSESDIQTEKFFSKHVFEDIDSTAILTVPSVSVSVSVSVSASDSTTGTTVSGANTTANTANTATTTATATAAATATATATTPDRQLPLDRQCDSKRFNELSTSQSLVSSTTDSGLCIVSSTSLSNPDEYYSAAISLPPIGCHADLKPTQDMSMSMPNNNDPNPNPNPNPRHHRRASTMNATFKRPNSVSVPSSSTTAAISEISIQDSVNSLASSSPGTTSTRETTRETTSNMTITATTTTRETTNPTTGTTTTTAITTRETTTATTDENEFHQSVSRLTAANKHLLISDFMTNLLTTLHFLIDYARVARSNHPTTTTGQPLPSDDSMAMPWDCIYPKSKDGAPMYNSSGKYILKLFWMGAWRKVVVDDRVPIDAAGRALLLVSPNPAEMWPTLISKALLKLAVASWRDDPDANAEFGDFDFLHAIKGWVPERIPISPGPASTLQTSAFLTAILHRQTKDQASSSSTKQWTDNIIATTLGIGRPSALGGGGPSSITTNLNPPQPTRTPISFPILFGTRKQSDFKKYSERGGAFYQHLPCAYRIIDTHRIASHNARGFLMRHYLSSGIKKGPKQSDDVEFNDNWILADELGTLFSSLVCYHSPNTFRTTKHAYVFDAQKLCETIRTPFVVHVANNMFVSNDPGVLISLATFGRVAATLVVEEFNLRDPAKDPVVRMTTNGTASTFLTSSPGTAYRVTVEANTAFHLSIYSKDDYSMDEEAKYVIETLGLRMREFEDTLAAQPAGAWTVIFKHVLMVNEDTFVSCNFYSADSLMMATSVRAINNDSGEEVEQSTYGILPFATLAANKSGYTLVAESRATVARAPTKWKFRLYSDVLSGTMVDKEIFTSKMTIQDVNETYIPNRHNVLFRSLVKIKDGILNSTNMSVQVDFSFLGIWLDIVLYDNDVEIGRGKGKGIVTIYNILIHPSEDAPIPAKSAASGAGSDKSKTVAGNTPAATATVAITPPKHKYILQCSVAVSDVDKLTNGAAIAAELQRPNSRSGKSVSSAGKKKKASVLNSIHTGTPSATGPTSGASPAAPTIPEVHEFSWHARYITSDATSLVIVKDTEKDDRYKAVKETWEAAAPGRAAKSKETRDSFVKMCELGLKGLHITHQDKVYRPWSLAKTDTAPRVLVFGDRGGAMGIPVQAGMGESVVHVPVARENSRNHQKSSRPTTAFPNTEEVAAASVVYGLTYKTISTGPCKVLTDTLVEDAVHDRLLQTVKFSESQTEVIKRRQSDKESRQTAKKHLLELLDARLRDYESVQYVDAARRDMYRVRVLAEREEEAQARLRAMMDASKAAEMAAESAEEATDKKGRKGGKK